VSAYTAVAEMNSTRMLMTNLSEKSASVVQSFENFLRIRCPARVFQLAPATVGFLSIAPDKLVSSLHADDAVAPILPQEPRLVLFGAL
jgi:hypothetical protein